MTKLLTGLLCALISVQCSEGASGREPGWVEQGKWHRRYNEYTFRVSMNPITINRLGSIMIQNIPITRFGISPIFCLLCSFLFFLGMRYADNLYL